MSRSRWLLLAPLLLCGTRSFAAEALEHAATNPVESVGENSSDVFEILDEERYALLDIHALVVTGGGGVKEDRSLAAANITVITADDMLRHGWRSVADALSNVPGLYVIDDGVSQTLSVRGFNGGLQSGTRIVKIMINGVAVNFRPELNAMIGPEYLPVEAIDRIEIAKGPLSALYGANAFLATVNVITKSYEHGWHAEVSGRGNYQMGSPHAGEGMTGLLMQSSEHIDLLAAVAFDNLDRSGLPLQRTFAAQSLSSTQNLFGAPSRNDGSSPLSSYIQLRLKSQSIGTLTLQGGLQSQNSAAEFSLNSVLTHDSKISLMNLWSSALYENQWTKLLSTQLTLGWSDGRHSDGTKYFLTDNPQSYFVPHDGYQALDGGASAALAFELVRVKAGIDFEWDNENTLYYTEYPLGQTAAAIPLHDASLATSQVLTNVAGYAQVSTNPIRRLPKLVFTANGRLDRLSYGPLTIPLQYSWRAAVAYSWTDNLVTKVFAGRAFQGPSGVLMFAEPGFGNNNNVIGQYNLFRSGLATAPLTPQVVNSVEAVAAGRLWNVLSLEGAAFFNQIDDQILFNRQEANFVAANAGSVQFIGVEATAKLAINRFSGFVSASYEQQLNQDDADTQLNAPRKAIELFPNFQTFIGLDVSAPEIFLQLTALARIVGPRGSSASNSILNNLTPYELPAYWDFDVTLSTKGWTPFGEKSETILLASAHNLLGRARSEPGFGGYDIPQAGRTFLFEVRQSF